VCIEKFIDNLKNLEKIDIEFLLFLNKNGYLDKHLVTNLDDIIVKNKLKKCMTEFLSIYSYEKIQ
jgi:hypothetical protein